MEALIRCTKCREAADKLYPMGGDDWWCERCVGAEPIWSVWEPTGDPVDAQGYYRRQVTEMRHGLAAWQQEVEKASDPRERERKEGGLQAALARYGDLVALFAAQNWTLPNPRWKLKTAADKVRTGQLQIARDDLDDLADDLRIMQWGLEPEPGSAVSPLDATQWQLALETAEKSLFRKVLAAGGITRATRWESRDGRDEVRRIQLEDLEELWLLHHLARRRVALHQRIADQDRQAHETRKSLFGLEPLGRWTRLCELTTPPASVFPGLRLTRLPNQEELERQRRVEQAKRVWESVVSNLSTVTISLGTGERPGPASLALPGLIHDLRLYLELAAGSLRPEAVKHLEAVLATGRDLRQRIDEMEAWAALAGSDRGDGG